jgi:hypothetical protein
MFLINIILAIILVLNVAVGARALLLALGVEGTPTILEMEAP